jgi:DUF1680 family protein
MAKEKRPTYTRRAFAAGLAGACGLAAQQSKAPQPATAPAGLKGPVPAFPKRPFLLTPEVEPFAGPLTFARRDIKPRLQPFPMTQVRLLAGDCRQASEWSRGFMSRLPVDRLLHNFRVNAGLPSSATPFGGKEAPTSPGRGAFVGHYLSACGLLSASAGDKGMKSRGDELVSGLAECQAKLAKGGYLSAFPTDSFERLDQGRGGGGFYTLHKIMAGLLDMYTCAGNKQALEVLIGMANWADEWTAGKSEEHMQEILKTEYGGMNEVLYNLASATSEPRWARAGDRFTKKAFFNPLALSRDELRVLHANTHIPQVIGAARRYEISGDMRFHDVAHFFWETIYTSHMYVTGGTSNSERWLEEPRRLAAELQRATETQECCCAYNLMKLTRHLYQWNGEPRYMDYYERVLFNHRLGGIQPGTGHTIYHLSMTPGAWKTLCTEDKTFWCCTGTALEEYAKLNNTIFYSDGEGVYVNLFIPAELDWSERQIRLRQQTKFPDEPRTVITVEATAAAPWTMNLRIPGWTSSKASVSINGSRLTAMTDPGGYLKVSRRWKQGDRVELEMPMRLAVEAMPDDHRVQAFLYGPIVLAGELGMDGLTDALIHDFEAPDTTRAPMDVPGLVAGADDPATWIKPTGKAPLTFRTTGQARDFTFSPLNRLWQRFAVYWLVV